MCARTLASLKTASLFSYHAAQDPEDDVKHLNRIFRDKGVELLILKREENAMLIYVCRRTQLAKDLERPGAKELLERYGYTDHERGRRDRAAAHAACKRRRVPA